MGGSAPEVPSRADRLNAVMGCRRGMLPAPRLAGQAAPRRRADGPGCWLATGGPSPSRSGFSDSAAVLAICHGGTEAHPLQGRSTVRRQSSVLCVSMSAVQINRAPSRHQIAS